ncbi:MAG TPA: hypothetical protein VK866_03460 [Acidimicrobiales bacterium]|nr:hypothetical protein [Acidimicrobiales bacterium]
MSGAAALAEGAVLAPVAGPVVSLVPVAVAVVALAAAARSAPARTPLGPAPDRPRSSPLAALGGAVRRRLGRPADPAADLRVGRIVVLAIGAALVDPLLGVTGAGGGLVQPRWTRRRAAARARRQHVAELP